MAETNEHPTNSPTNPPTQQAPHTLSTIKLHILKKGEYDIWAMKIERYLEHTDYPIWEVIQKENGLVQVSTYTLGQIRVLPPKTAEEILAREKERKARTTSLMPIPGDYLAKFYKMTDAKEMFQSLLSQLEIHGAGVSTEGANQKFLRVFEYDVKGSTGSSSSTQNVAFVSSDSTSSTNEVNIAYGVSNFSGNNSQREEEIDLKWQVAMISIRLKKFYKKTRRKLHFYAKEPVSFNKKKVKCFNCHNTRHFARECRSKGNQESRRTDAGNTGYKARDNRRRPAKQDEPKAMVTIDGEGLSKLLNSQMSAKDKFRLGYETQIHKGVLSYENEVLQSMVDSRPSDVEDSPVNDRFAKVKGMHAVPPSMTGIYMPLKSNFGINESKFTYGPKQSNNSSELDAKTSYLASCESNSSVETLKFMLKPIESKPKVVSEPKVWSDAPIIEEYKSDSDDEYVQTVKDHDTCILNPKVDKREWTGVMSKSQGLGYGYTKKACFVCGSFGHLIRDCDFHEKRMVKQVELNKSKNKVTSQRNARPVWNNVQRLNHQNKFVPTAILTKTGRFLVNVARQKFSSQATSTSTVRKVNTARQIVNDLRPRNNLFKSHSPIRGPFTRTTAPKANFTNHKVNNAEDKTISVVGGNRETTVKASAGVSTGCYVLNKVLVTKPHNKTPYELLTGKFEEKSDEGFLVGYSLNSKAFRPVTLKNKANKTTGPEEANNSAGAAKASSTNYVNTASTQVNTTGTTVTIASPSRNVNAAGPSNPNLLPYANQDDSQIPSLKDIYEVPNDGIFISASYDDEDEVADFANLESTVNVSPIPQSRIHSIHLTTQILRDPHSTVQTRSKVNKSSGAHALLTCLLGEKIIGTKWVYRNKKDERGVIVRNKARLVAQGNRQEEGIDYDEVFAHMARLEAIKIFLAFSSYMGFKVYQIDVKSAFLYGKIDEDVYVSQPLGFIDLKFPKKVYKVVNALRGIIDKTMFIKKDQKDIMLVQVYVDDIIFGSTKKSWCDEFEALMKNRFQMSSMSEITFFLGLQVKQREDEIFISRDKYVTYILKKFDFISVKTASTPIETKKPLVKDTEATDVDVHLFRSMIGSLMYLTASRLDIMYAVCACSRFQFTPKTSHLQAVKRIFRFCVKDVRCLLDDVFLPKAEVPTWWIKSIPIKINIFAWKLCLDRLPTRVNLAKRNMAVASLLFPLCDSSMKDAAHLFLRCDMAKDVMFLVSRWWDLEDHRFGSFQEWLAWFNSIRLGAKSKGVLEGVFYISW
uniref:Retrovirus-related Pol polyprotein from transposon TNT 1-94 n=1 Tax=Tanacetum cinerariifolium TaxID=118510 RepID=A0A6L2J8N3_TANCI|nr:retrovirus-related Pol polyprotein from transposon TNT 1-94 [Tanacetum cinerariifolium]